MILSKCWCRSTGQHREAQKLKVYRKFRHVPLTAGKLVRAQTNLGVLQKLHHNAEKSCWRPGWSFFELAACAPELLSKLSAGIHIKAFRVMLDTRSFCFGGPVR